MVFVLVVFCSGDSTVSVSCAMIWWCSAWN